MVKEEKRVGWGIVIATAILTTIATTFVNQVFNSPAVASKVNELETQFDNHITFTESAHSAEIQQNSTRIAVLEAELRYIKLQLDEIKKGQDRLLRAVNQR